MPDRPVHPHSSPSPQPARRLGISSLLPLLAPFLAHPESAGVLTDFDGTLAPIVDDPRSARPLPGVPTVLRRLVASYARVAVVSGRPVQFLLQHLGGTGAFLSGLYGLEWVEDGTVFSHPLAQPWREVVEEAACRAESSGPPGLLVERKGMSLTLHFRTNPSLEQATKAWAQAEAERTGLVVHPARQSFELRLPIERDKGTAVAEAAAGLQAACFLGDDRGDVPAFDALDQLAANGGAALRVGVRSIEAPLELLERADLVVDGPEGALAVLEALVPEATG